MAVQTASRGLLASSTMSDSLTAMLVSLKVLGVPYYPSPYGFPSTADDYRLLHEKAAVRSFQPLVYSPDDIDFLMNKMGLGAPLAMRDYESQASYGLDYGTKGGIGSAHQLLEGLWRYVRERKELPRAEGEIGWRLRTSTPVGNRRIEIFWSVWAFEPTRYGLGLKLVADAEKDWRLGAWPI